jgi:type I restriction enzyme S subunit
MYASVGFVAINKIPIATSQAVLNLILEQDICVDYIYYFLLDFQKYLAEYITTGTQGNLNAQTVKGFVVPIPSSEEQTKIANFLSAIDEKIALVSNQIQDTQEYKKGLLQQMFV